MPLPSRSFALLAFLLILSFFNVEVRAGDFVPPVKDDLESDTKDDAFDFVTTEDDARDANFNKGMATEEGRAYSCRAIFPDSSSPLFPTLNAGTKAKSLIAYHNHEPFTTIHIILASGNIILPYTKGVIQNFSMVRHGRTVRPGETATLEYRFTPHSSMEPGLYKVSLHLHCVNVTDNRTFLVTAFEGEVMIGDTLNTDPRTILTYFTLIAIVSVMIYGISARLGIIKKITAQWQNRKRNTQTHVDTETGTVDNSYDPEYISAEHLRYRDAMLKRHNSPSGAHKKK